MKHAKLALLLALLKIYRAHFCFEGDRYERHVSAVIRDIRFALANNGFYYIERKQAQ